MGSDRILKESGTIGAHRRCISRQVKSAVSLILTSLDRIKMILSVLEATEAEPPGEDSELIERLNAFAEGRLGADEAPAAAAPRP